MGARRAVLSIAVVTVLGLVLAACGSPATSELMLAAGQYCAGAPGTGPAPRPTKVMVIVGENHSADEIPDSDEAQFQRTLAGQCGSLTNMHNETHGSESNYIALVSGDYPQWALCDYPPNHSGGTCPYAPTSMIAGPSLFGQMEQAHGSTGWRTYASSMGYLDAAGKYVPKNCQRFDGVPYTGADGKRHALYGVRHNPAVYFSSLTSCKQYDVPLGDFTLGAGAFYQDVTSGGLPTFSLVVPNDVENSHDTSMGDFDNYLQQVLDFVQASPDYLSGDLVVVITYDEGGLRPKTGRAYVGQDCTDPNQGSSQPSCQIPTFVVGRYVPHYQDGQFLTHYSILKTIEQWAGLPLLGHAALPSTNTLDPRSLLTPA
jgi:acid phosphatase